MDLFNVGSKIVLWQFVWPAFIEFLLIFYGITLEEELLLWFDENVTYFLVRAL